MINPEVLNNIEFYRDSYKKNGWVSIPNFLTPDLAESLHDRLKSEQSWEIATIREERPFVVSLQEFHQQSFNFKNDFMSEILNYARNNDFQYFYEFIRLLGADSRTIEGYDDIKNLLGKDSYQKTMCELTSLDKCTQMDAQLTKYSPGCFLKQHCDTRIGDGEVRHAALIISLTKNWRSDFGGLLHVQNDKGEIVKTLTPEFNTLNILSIPFDHFVSQVANYANRIRFSLIGWLWKRSPDSECSLK
jgi:Rps23 Pro-64 3,4-dihydroxylase Tpa1-like proline 4-hydroxylase